MLLHGVTCCYSVCYTLLYIVIHCPSTLDYDIVLHAVTLCYMLLPVLLMLHLVTYHKRL